MTTAKIIVQDTADFVESINGLFETETFEAALDLAVKMGFQDQINQGVDGLVEVLAEINARLELIREPLVHMSALAALIRIIDPLFAGLGRLVDTSSKELEQAGLGSVLALTGKVSSGVSYGREFLISGERVLAGVPTEAELDNLKDSFEGLSESLETYKKPLASTS